MAEERLKLLLVAHDPALVRSLTDMLAGVPELAQPVTAVNRLEDALGVIKGNRPELVLLDVSIPDGAGLGSISVLTAGSPPVAVVALGETSGKAVTAEALEAGAVEYLVKQPLSAGWLECAVRSAIHQRAAIIAAADASYHSIFDHLVEGIFRTTPDGHYLLANPALARIYGYASPEDLMTGITDIARRLYVQEGRREEFIRLMQEHDTIIDFESETYRKDGSTIWISENCRAIRDKDGKLLYYEGSVEDITQRRQAEEKHRASETLYHSLVENSPQNIFRKDIQGRFTFANQHYCDHYQCKLEDILGKTDFDFFPTELAEKYRRDDWRVFETGQTMNVTEEHQPMGRPKTYVQVVKSPLYGANGRIIGLQGMFWDVTAERVAEERLRKANLQVAQSRKELHAKNLQLEEDLKMAREIQLSMLPNTYPTFPQHATPEESAFQFTHRYLPASSVGGDFFTLSALSDTAAAVFICDVAGHGVRSSLVTAMIRALVEELKPIAGEPGQFLTKLNQDLHSMLRHAGTPMLTTAFYLVADFEKGTMQYSNAGHPKPLHLRRSAKTVEPLINLHRKSQAALGLFAEARYQTSEVKISAGDAVLLFTDGLFEVEGSGQELYSQTMLLGDVQERLALPAQQLFDEVLEKMRRFSAGGKFEDDVCLVGMEITSARPS